jgi:hypothetical protein
MQCCNVISSTASITQHAHTGANRVPVLNLHASLWRRRAQLLLQLLPLLLQDLPLCLQLLYTLLHLVKMVSQKPCAAAGCIMLLLRYLQAGLQLLQLLQLLACSIAAILVCTDVTGESVPRNNGLKPSGWQKQCWKVSVVASVQALIHSAA